MVFTGMLFVMVSITASREACANLSEKPNDVCLYMCTQQTAGSFDAMAGYVQENFQHRFHVSVRCRPSSSP